MLQLFRLRSTARVFRLKTYAWQVVKMRKLINKGAELPQSHIEETCSTATKT